MKHSITAAALLGSVASVAQAQTIDSYCPATNVCYSLNIPDETVSSGSGDIYFQISAPTTYSWVGLAQGQGMSNTNIFIIYTDSTGSNVTLSPRLGTGEFEPQHTTSSDVELLEGSGVTNGIMTANIRCGNCNSWGSGGASMDFTSSSASLPWVYAYQSGNPINSDDVEESLSEHNAAEDFSWNAAAVQGGANSNPFITAAALEGDTPATGESSGVTESSSGGGPDTNAILLAHGILASVAFVAIFPTGGILIRLASFPGLIWIHAGLQMLGHVVFIAAFGLGLYYAINGNYMSEAHVIIGIVLFALLFAQPIGGFLHHHLFKKRGGRTIVSYMHINLGRFAIILGMINGGLGIQLSGVETRYMIAYAVCAGVMGVVYLASIVIGEMRRSRRTQIDSSFEKNENSSQEGMAKRPTSRREN